MEPLNPQPGILCSPEREHIAQNRHAIAALGFSSADCKVRAGLVERLGAAD